MSTVLDIDRVWTPADLDDLPDDLDWRRVEIVDGMLVVSPQPDRSHVYANDVLFALLARTAPEGLHVSATAAAFGIGRTYRVPDLGVMPTHSFRGSGWTFDASELVMAVEIESPSSITTDRITKPAEYASVGVAHYWRVELDPIRLHAYRLIDGAYVESGSWGFGAVARMTDPFPVEIDIASLLPG